MPLIHGLLTVFFCKARRLRLWRNAEPLRLALLRLVCCFSAWITRIWRKSKTKETNTNTNYYNLQILHTNALALALA